MELYPCLLRSSPFFHNRYGPINSSTATAAFEFEFFMLCCYMCVRYGAAGHFFRWKCWNKKNTRTRTRGTTTQCVGLVYAHNTVEENHKYQNLFTWNHFFCMKHSPIYILPSLNFVLGMCSSIWRYMWNDFLLYMSECALAQCFLLWICENSSVSWFGAGAGNIYIHVYMLALAMIDCWVYRECGENAEWNK